MELLKTALERGISWPFSKSGRNVLAWIAAIYLGSSFLFTAWVVNGHITCDFGGQWLMGRMYYHGMAEELYLAEPQRKVFAGGYKAGDPPLHDLVLSIENAELRESIRDRLDENWKKMDNDVLAKNHANFQLEGALYPPTAGLLFWPFAVMPPQASHAVVTSLHFFLVILCGWFISRITGHRVQWGEAVFLIFALPNCFQAFLLGQNTIFSLTFLCAGWYSLHRGRPFLAGFIWGAFAYKPVFALSLLLVPILLPNLRMLLGMMTGGLLFCLATLPYVGTHGLDRFCRRLINQPVDDSALVQGLELTSYQEKKAGDPPPHDVPRKVAERMNPWERWLIVGRNASHIYSIDTNWVWMSRDLVSVPRRRMWDAEGMHHTWRYVYERFVQGRDTWYSPKPELEAQMRRRENELWPPAMRETLQEEYQEWRTNYAEETTRQLEEWENQNRNDWAEHQQKTYDPGKANTPEAKELAAWHARNATIAGGVLLIGLVVATALVALATWFLSKRGGLCPPQATGSRAAFLLIAGIMSCWHFMYYDMLLLVLPLCLMLADLQRRSWPRDTKPVIALAALTFAPFTLWYLTQPGFMGDRIPGGAWVPWALLGAQIGIGLTAAYMTLATRRFTWLLVTLFALLVLGIEIVGFAGIQLAGWDHDGTMLIVEGAVCVLPLLGLLCLQGGRIWLLLITFLLILSNWDMAFSNGIQRFPFDIPLALVLWGWAGVLSFKECRTPSSGEDDGICGTPSPALLSPA